MDFDPLQIHDLTMDEIAGIITSEEKKYLYEVITKSQQAFEIWQELHKSIGAQQIREAQESMRAVEPLEIIGTLKRKKRTQLTIQIAAVLVAMIAGLYILLQPPENKLKEHQYMAALPDSVVRLNLENGKIVAFFTGNGHQDEKEAKFDIQNDSVNYTVNQPLTGLSTLTVPKNAKRFAITLSDGSIVQLNANSKMIFSLQFTGNTREITLEGEAYIKAAPDANRPLLVHLPNEKYIKVLGTEFNINTHDSGLIKVALLKGAVIVYNRKDSTFLRPKYELVMSDKTTETRHFDADTLLCWRTDVYDLDNMNIKEACRILECWYSVKIILDNKAIEKGAVFGPISREKDIRSHLNTLKDAGLINRYYYNNGIWHLE